MIRAVQFRLALVATVLLLQISFHTAHASGSTLVGDVDGNGEVETTDLDMVIGRMPIFPVKPAPAKDENSPYVSTSSSARPCSRREA